jgi:exopolysaccharide production protein ExoZ
VQSAELLPVAENEGRRDQALDNLRGVAILGVMAFHVGIDVRPPRFVAELIAFGERGVQLFFLVSAVTMMHMWDRRRSEPRPAARFLVRRFMRIVPIYWVAIAFYLSYWGWGPRGTATDGIQAHDVWFSALMVHGWSLSAINSVVPGGWSIAAEVGFYLAFPWLAHRLQVTWQYLLAALAVYLAAGVAVESALQAYALDGSSYRDSLWLYYSLLTQMPVFLVGMGVYAAWRGRTGQSYWRLALVVLLWLAVAAALKQAGWMGRPFLWLQVVLMATIVHAALRTGWYFGPLAWMGRLSYSMYLSHFAVLAVLISAWPATAREGLGAYAAALTTCLTLTLAISAVSQRTLERWTSKLGASWARNLK